MATCYFHRLLRKFGIFYEPVYLTFTYSISLQTVESSPKPSLVLISVFTVTFSIISTAEALNIFLHDCILVTVCLKSFNWSINQSINQSVSQSVSQSFSQSINNVSSYWLQPIMQFRVVIYACQTTYFGRDMIVTGTKFICINKDHVNQGRVFDMFDPASRLQFQNIPHQNLPITTYRRDLLTWLKWTSLSWEVCLDDWRHQKT